MDDDELWMAVDADGVVTQWAEPAARVTGVTADEAVGRPGREVVGRLLLRMGELAAGDGARRTLPGWRVAPRDGGGLVLRASAPGPGGTPPEPDPLHEAYERTAFDQAAAGLEIYDADLRVVRVNGAALRLRRADRDAVVGHRVSDLESQIPLSRLLTEALREETAMFERMVRTPEDRRRACRVFSVNVYPLLGTDGTPIGAASAVRDITAQARARDQLELLGRARERIGRSLDVVRTAQELAEVAVGDFADTVVVDILEPVIEGDEPPVPPLGGDVPLRRAAFETAAAAEAVYAVGETSRYVFATPYGQALEDLKPRLLDPLEGHADWVIHDPELRVPLSRGRARSLIIAPLTNLGRVLGLACFYRDRSSPPFEEGDIGFAGQLTTRASVHIDNARRFTREHSVATLLQRGLLPRATPEVSALTTSHCYLAGESDAHWFDVIQLSGARVGLVIGQVPGESLHASVSMGRFRTAASTLASLELRPEEVLAHLDEVAVRIGGEQAGDPLTHSRAPMGVRCLYAVYDPVTGELDLASAAVPLPLLTLPGGTVEPVGGPVGPELGTGATYESHCAAVPAESLLTLHSASVLGRGPAAEDRLVLMHAALGRDHADPAGACEEVVRMLRRVPYDGVALLLARIHRLPGDHVAEWTLPGKPSTVAACRAQARAKLAEWGLDEQADTAEFVVSELVTNAVQHASGPVALRLVRDRVLTIEVTDQVATVPHLRHAPPQAEDGRGLFIVATLTDRWGTRYSDGGKTVWAQIALDDPGG